MDSGMREISTAEYRKLCELLAATSIVTPKPVKQNLLQHKDLLDITEIFQQLQPNEVKEFTRTIVKIQGMEKLKQLVMHVLRREIPSYCPFLTHVIDTFEGEEALSIAQLILNLGSNEHLEMIVGSKGLSQEKLASIISADCTAIPKEVVRTVHELWEAESKVYAKEDPVKAREKVRELPSYKKLDELRKTHKRPIEKRWLDEEQRLMLQNNDDLVRLGKDWPAQRDWLESHLKNINRKTRLEDIVALINLLDEELKKIKMYPEKHIRYAHPAWNHFDVELLRLIVSEGARAGEALPKKMRDEVKALLERCIARHDERLVFPNRESKNVVKASTDELKALYRVVEKLERQSKDTPQKRLSILGDIDMCKFRCRLLLALSTKHLQHKLYAQGAGLLCQRLLPRLEACPKVAQNVLLLLNENVLDKDGRELYDHCVLLRKERDKLLNRLDALSEACQHTR